VIIGGFMSALGFILSLFAPNISVLFITFGLISGVGLSMTFSGAVVSVTYYFEKKRAIATGLTGLQVNNQILVYIAVCGTGIGTCIFAPFIEFILSEYGWDRALMILAAILFTQCFFGRHPSN
jgi:MFS family permease